LPDALAAEIVERADGVPLFVEELTRAVIGGAVPAARRWLARRLPSSIVPPALQSPSPGSTGSVARAKLRRSARCSARIPYELIARVAAAAEADLQAALTGAGLCFCRVAPRSSYLFKHALIQDAATRRCCGRAARSCIAPQRKRLLASSRRSPKPNPK
jgi:hypothetical protein